MFTDDLMILDRLRTEAINVHEPHISGISRLVTYAAQLKWLGGKFPVDVSARWTWQKRVSQIDSSQILTLEHRSGWISRGIRCLDSIPLDQVRHHC
jgi:hypothetical protein